MTFSYKTTATFAQLQTASTLDRMAAEMETALEAALRENETVTVEPSSDSSFEITVWTWRDLEDAELNAMFSEIWDSSRGHLDKGTDLEVTFGALAQPTSAVMVPGP